MINQNKKSRSAFTLVETLVVLMLSAMIVAATLSVYQRVRAATVVIGDQMSRHRLQDEILQKIAEDIDRLAAPGFEATIKFRNRSVSAAGGVNFQSAELILNNSYYGNNDKKDIYEEIVWRTAYDADEETMILYRMHRGLNAEDPLFANKPNQIESTLDKSLERYIPVAAGVTFFDLRTQQGENVLGAWTSETLPKAVRIGLSFAWPVEMEDGSVAVPDDEIMYRTVAVDRSRMIPYNFVKMELDLGVLDDETDPNDLDDEMLEDALTEPDDESAEGDETESRDEEI